MFAHKTIIEPTTNAVSSPLEILTSDNDLMGSMVQSIVIQVPQLGEGESVTVYEGKGPTPIWEIARVWNAGIPVVIDVSSGSVCLEGRGVRYAVTKTATASPVGVYAVIQYERG